MEEISDFEDWEYRAEGNLHIIVANKRTKQVLRLLKCHKDQTIYGDVSGFDIENEICFIRNVAIPLMRNCKACFHVERAPLSRDFLKNISKRVEPHRPTSRLNKIIDQRCKYGMLMPDFCRVLPNPTSHNDVNISIEIKPKQGFILIGQNRCNYSQFQRNKVLSKFYEKESTYCPLDLFSGCKKRMKKAIKALIHHPQNNLRIFKNGHMIYSQEIVDKKNCDNHDLFKATVLGNFVSHSDSTRGTAERLKRAAQNLHDLICNLLLHPICEQKSDRGHVAQYCDAGFSNEEAKKLKSPLRKQTLPTNSILGLLLSLQKLESRSINEYYDMYMSIKNQLAMFPHDAQRLSIEGPYDSEHWKKLVFQITKGDTKSTAESDLKKLNDLDIKASLLRKFLIATSFKDCSIILTFQKKLHDCDHISAKDSPISITTRHGQQYWCSLALVDSDPKLSNRIPQYYQDACKQAA
uniref:inositol-pentakisphosphate 2-kinase-like n=1 Tax=Styela clava TaxID=7725 RepID=UPI00193A8E0F|nr:inositol-pentakisphosphate 2-kinase-like [Styela clava]